MHYILWLVISALWFAAGEYWSKRLALDPSWRHGTTMAVCYLLGTLAWVPAILQKKELIVAGTIWSVLTMLATVGIGVAMGEAMTPRITLGVGFALAAVLCLAS